jgi:hypothetical protein
VAFDVLGLEGAGLLVLRSCELFAPAGLVELLAAGALRRAPAALGAAPGIDLLRGDLAAGLGIMDEPV